MSFVGNRHAVLLVSVTVASPTGSVTWLEFVTRTPTQTVRGIVNMTAIAVVEAQDGHDKRAAAEAGRGGPAA